MDYSNGIMLGPPAYKVTLDLGAFTNPGNTEHGDYQK